LYSLEKLTEQTNLTARTWPTGIDCHVYTCATSKTRRNHVWRWKVSSHCLTWRHKDQWYGYISSWYAPTAPLCRSSKAFSYWNIVG